MATVTKFYKIINAMPSFTDVFTKPDGSTASNPFPNYGQFGNHLDDYFNHHMRETPAGGVDNLVAFLTCSKSLTTFESSSLTSATNYLYNTFGVTHSTEGYALLDFRSSPTWNTLNGDGIVGQSNSSSDSFVQVKNSAISIINHFSTVCPSVKWSYVGLPHIPQTVVYAPNSGTAHAWSPDNVNTGSTAVNYWDENHPTVGSLYKVFYQWAYAPDDLKQFHRDKCVDSIREILDASDWLCPDINPSYSNWGVYKHFYSIDNKRYHTQDLMTEVSDYVNSYSGIIKPEVYPFVNTLVHSRVHATGNAYFDDSRGYFNQIQYLGITDSNGEPLPVIPIHTDYIGYDVSQSECHIPEAMLKGGMIIPASELQCDGFVYLDQMPFAINFKEVSGASGFTGFTGDMTGAYETVLGRTNYLIREDIGENSNLLSINEIKTYYSYNNSATNLRNISEVIPVGDRYWSTMYVSGSETGDGSSIGVTAYESARWFSQASSITPESGLLSFGPSFLPPCCPDINCCISPPGACPTCTPSSRTQCAALGGVPVSSCEACIGNNNDAVCCRIGNLCQETTRCDCALQGGTIYVDCTVCECIRDCGTSISCFGIVGESISTTCPPTYHNCGFTCYEIVRNSSDGCCSSECIDALGCPGYPGESSCNDQSPEGGCDGAIITYAGSNVPSSCRTSCPPPPAGTQACCPIPDDIPSVCERCPAPPAPPAPPGVPFAPSLGPIGPTESTRSTTTYDTLYDFLADSNVDDETKMEMVQRFTGLMGFTSISDFYRYAVRDIGRNNINQVGYRELGRLVTNNQAYYSYYSDLKINNSYIKADYNFRINSPFTINTANRIRAESSGGDMLLVKYRYIP